jgi:hypothetical protein
MRASVRPAPKRRKREKALDALLVGLDLLDR